MLLVEQTVRRSLQVARRAYVLDQGAITLAGPAREDIQCAYLGL